MKQGNHIINFWTVQPKFAGEENYADFKYRVS